jgi:hypothetical protein
MTGIIFCAASGSQAKSSKGIGEGMVAQEAA